MTREPLQEQNIPAKGSIDCKKSIVLGICHNPAALLPLLRGRFFWFAYGSSIHSSLTPTLSQREREN
jgi:hypothetical protein